jgi:hypothetical protein
VKVLLALIGVVALLLVVSSVTAKPAKPAPAPVAAAAPPAPTVAPTVAPARPAPTTVPKPTIAAPAYPTFVPSAPAQGQPAGPTGGKCADYASQAEAQAALRRDPVRAGRLDDDRDGIACEGNPAPFDRAPVARSARP